MSAKVSRRIEGIDLARGLAGLIMIQGHAYHGWVAPEHHGSASYQLTRLLGTLPLPAFLLLAGASVALRTQAAHRRRERAQDVRAHVARRGLQIVLFGYLVSAASMLMDGGEGLDTLLRSDVLHVIGLSIALHAVAGIRGDHEGIAAPRRLSLAAAIIGVAVTLASPLFNSLTPEATGAARYIVGLVGDVPGVTLMPLVPLAAWFSTGVLLTQLLLRRRQGAPDDVFASIAGAPARVLWAVLATAVSVAAVATPATAWLTASLGGGLTRAHPAVVLNVVDLAARGAIVLSVGALLAPYMPRVPRAVLLRVGRGSLTAYVFHIPFCYGALGRPLSGQLTVAEATPLVALLMAASLAAVWAWDSLKARLRQRPTAPGPTTAPARE